MIDAAIPGIETAIWNNGEANLFEFDPDEYGSDVMHAHMALIAIEGDEAVLVDIPYWEYEEADDKDYGSWIVYKNVKFKPENIIFKNLDVKRVREFDQDQRFD